MTTRAREEKQALKLAIIAALALLIVFCVTAKAQTVVVGGSGGATINPTNGLPAVRSNATTFRDGVAADFVTLFSSCSGIQYLGFDGACHTASGSPAGANGNIQAKDIGGSGAFAGITDTTYDNNPTFAGTNSVVLSATRLYPGVGHRYLHQGPVRDCRLHNRRAREMHKHLRSGNGTRLGNSSAGVSGQCSGR